MSLYGRADVRKFIKEQQYEEARGISGMRYQGYECEYVVMYDDDDDDDDDDR